MSEKDASSLRGWAVACALYGPTVGALFGVMPWKTPWINALGCGYAAAYVVLGLALWRRARWARSLGLVAAGIGLVACVVVLAGIAASLGHLRGAFGALGAGPIILVALFAATVFQALGLFPTLLLRALLRDRAARAAGVAAALAMAVILGGGLHAESRVGLSPVPALGARERTQAVQAVRAALAGGAADTTALRGVPLGPGPLFVTLWRGGKPVARAAASGPDLEAAVRHAGSSLARELAGHAQDGQLRFDRTSAIGHLPRGPLGALTVAPGLDGVAAASDLERAVLPDELLARGAFASAPLIPGYAEVRFGLDVTILAGLGDSPLVRLRTESWLDAGGAALGVRRGNTAGPPATAGSFAAAARAAGEHLLGLQGPDGRFGYRYFPMTDTFAEGYSLARHAGAAYGLTVLGDQTGEPRFAAGAELGLTWLRAQVREPCGAPGHACVVTGTRAELCPNALTAVALLEHRRRRHDTAPDPLTEHLVAFIASLQQPSGDFHHVFDTVTGVVPTPRMQFCSEEAALALVLAHEAFGEASYLAAAERALDFATSRKYDFFLGRFVFGSDHWTCIAADEAFPRLRHARYLDFCTQYAAFMSRLQYAPGEAEPDFAGHYGIGSFIVPAAGATSSVAELLAATVSLAGKHGRPVPAARAQLGLALGALLRDQVRPETTWLFPAPRRAAGGFRRSLVEPEMRIDFAQHALLGLIRGAALLAS